MRSTVLAVVAVLVIITSGTAVRGQSPSTAGYKFTLISVGPTGGCDPGNGPLNGAPVLNNHGLVAFTDNCAQVTVGDGYTQRILSLEPAEAQLSINDAGVVAMLDAAFDSRTGSYDDRIIAVTMDGVWTAQLNIEDTPFVGRFYPPRINNGGSIVFGAGLPASQTEPNPIAIVKLDGRTLTTLFDPTTSTPLGTMNPQAYAAINDSGLAAIFGTSPGGSVLTTDGATVTVISDTNSGGAFPTLNNDGLAAFVDGSDRVVVGNGGPLQVIAETDGTNASSPFHLLQQPVINDDAGVAFMATLNSTDWGIFTGPDAVADKVVQTGDVLPVVPGGFTVYGIPQLSPEGLNDVGQIAFFADGVASTLPGGGGRAIIRADPPGSTPDNPILPADPAPPWRFPGVVEGRARASLFGYLDPQVASGYHFEMSGFGEANFASVVVPNPLPGGDSSFMVSFDGYTAPLEAGVPFDFTATVPGGVPEFTITGIDDTEALDPNDPSAFVTGVTFVNAFNGDIVMTPLTDTGGDTTPPVLDLPADITTVATSADGADVTYDATAHDNSDPSPSVSCTPASGTLFPIGKTTVSCVATDATGNTANGTFSVTVAYDFLGFFSPIGNPPVVNLAKAGSAVPVKFSLVGDKGLQILAPGSPVSQVITCGTGVGSTVVDETATAGKSELSYDPLTDEYTYVWKTDKAWDGSCRLLMVTLKDGSMHFASFQFTR